MISNYIDAQALIITDQHSTYHHLESAPHRYQHEFINHSAKEYVNDKAHISGIESVWAVMKRAF